MAAGGQRVWCGAGSPATRPCLRSRRPPGRRAKRARPSRSSGARVACAMPSARLPAGAGGARDSGGRRDTEDITGEIDPLTGSSRLPHRTHYGSVPLPDASGRSPWAGMSGAALFSGPLLVGVVTVDPAHFGSDRLQAVPVSAMTAEPAFRALLTVPPQAELPLEAVEDITTDWLKTPPLAPAVAPCAVRRPGHRGGKRWTRSAPSTASAATSSSRLPQATARPRS